MRRFHKFCKMVDVMRRARVSAESGTCARIVGGDNGTRLVSESDKLVRVLGQRSLRKAHMWRLLAHEGKVELTVAKLQVGRGCGKGMGVGTQGGEGTTGSMPVLA